MDERIYLDNNACTELDPKVLEYLLTNLNYLKGNPSSLHSFGRDARAQLTKARDKIAKYLDVKPKEIIFTSGGTEGINMVIKGIERGHIITSNVEHAAMDHAVEGLDVTRINVGAYGAATAEQVQNAIRPDTKLIALMAVNNETGVKTDVEAIAKVAQSANIPFFVDAVAQLGKEPVIIPKGVLAMCFSGQKCHSLKGSGFMFIRSGFKLNPLLVGGAHEYGRRAGSENLQGIIALGKSIEIIQNNIGNFKLHMETLRDKLEQAFPNAIINGEGPRVSNTSNLAFEGINGEGLLTALDRAGIAVSHGSACSSGALEPSKVLLQMGLPRKRVESSIRISLSRYTTEDEIDRCIATLKKLT